MAGQRRKNDVLGRIADLSEDAIQRLNDMPGGTKALNAFNTLRERVDDLSKRVRGLEDLEKRLAALERKVDKLSKSSGGTSSSSSRSKTTTTKSSGTSVKKS
jgi:hypothetical protein